MKKSNKVKVSLIAILLGFLLGCIILLITGRSPIEMFIALIMSFTGFNLETFMFNPRLIGEFIVQSMPIIMTGLSVGFAYRTGLFNIGAEGQFIMGALAATAIALPPGAPKIIDLPLVLLASMIAGGLWGAIPGILKAKFNVHEVVVTIMLNYTALHFNNWTIVHVFKSLDKVKTAEFASSALLKSPFLESITNGSRLNWGFIPVIIAIILYKFIIDKTSFGYSLRAVGFNKDGARYAGMPVERNIVLSMIIAGAFAGLGGAILTVGAFNFGRALPAAEGYGFDGIAVALVGSCEAVGILLAGLLFGMLKAAGPLMQSRQIPKDIAGIISSSIVLFVAMNAGIEWFLNKIEKKQKEAAQ